MSTILLSIKPEFAIKIFSGEKKYEFRKKVPKDLDRVVVYASAPVQRVIGEFSVLCILEGSIGDIWQYTAEKAGVSESFYREYFQGKDNARAIVVDKLMPYAPPKTLQDFGISKPPQSFTYIQS